MIEAEGERIAASPDRGSAAARAGASASKIDPAAPPIDLQNQGVLLHIDRPAMTPDAVARVFLGGTAIEGWLCAPGGVGSLGISVDGEVLNLAIEFYPRPDLSETFPDAAGAEATGFRITIPAATIPVGIHRVSLIPAAKAGTGAAAEFSLVVYPVPLDGPWALRRKMALSEVEIGQNILAGLQWHPNFVLLLGIGEVEEEIASARSTLQSLRTQAYRAWRLVVLRRGRTIPQGCAVRLLDGFDDICDRIEVRFDAPGSDLLANVAAGSTDGDPSALVGILLAGDVLGCDALLEMAIASGLHAEAELFYSDEIRVSPASATFESFFKPDWSPDLLTTTNYIGRFWCALPGVLLRAQANLAEWIQFGDYDLILRCTEATAGIHHVTRVLCQRGRPEMDHPEQERVALRRTMQRRCEAGEILDGNIAGHYRMKRQLLDERRVSVIIASCAADGLVKVCIETLRAKTAYRNFEIICVENIPAERRRWRQWLRQNVDQVISIKEPFNWSRFNNIAAHSAGGEFLVFLNDDMEIIEEGWLDALLEHAQRPEVGAVGARLLYPDRRMQHAGIFWARDGGRHAFRFLAEQAAGYFGLAVAERNVLAVTGACIAVRRSQFDALGGFDEKHTIINNDVDFCLRCWQNGQRVVYTPFATLIHHELASRRLLGEDFDRRYFAKRWRHMLQAGDPFYHPSLSIDRDDYAYEVEPIDIVSPSHPLLDRATVRNILAVKLDHIGDFITAIPALRRLRQRFPGAQLHLLAAPQAAALADLVPGIAGIIEFEFFFRRSGLGQRELSQRDLAALQARLEPYRFDIAVDLRKGPETRPLLRLSGASWLAGFDHGGQFPWLDVAMEWEQDPAGMPKHTHVGEDLVRLVDALATAALPDDEMPQPPTRLSTGASAKLGDRVSGRRRICVHPGAGSAIRRWPARHFAELIDLLATAHDAEFILVGSEDEAEIAGEILAAVQRPALVRSLVGTVELSELPGVLASAQLFIGNNSGPQHLAASLGVPTIGIHSGAVDAREWGPIGPAAVAIRRRTSCSPCYLTEAHQCPRHLACLDDIRPAHVFEVCRRLLAISAPGSGYLG